MTQLRESDDLPRYPEFVASRLALLRLLDTLFATSSSFSQDSSVLNILTSDTSSVKIRQKIAVAHLYEFQHHLRDSSLRASATCNVTPETTSVASKIQMRNMMTAGSSLLEH